MESCPFYVDIDAWCVVCRGWLRVYDATTAHHYRTHHHRFIRDDERLTSFQVAHTMLQPGCQGWEGQDACRAGGFLPRRNRLVRELRE